MLQPRPDPTQTDRTKRIAAAAFVAALALSSAIALLVYPFPHAEVDEHGHLSYVAWLMETGRLWPDFARMPLYDPSGAATATPNFINHPPTFYILAEPAYEAVRALGADPSAIRWFALALSLGAYGALGALGLRAGWAAPGFLCVFIASAVLNIPSYAVLFNNDQMALLGGALAVLGAYRRIERRPDGVGLALLLAGVALASVKLTAFLLVGLFASLALLMARPRDVRGLGALAVVGVLASVPFLALWAIDGGPAPASGGQRLMLREAAAAHGWDVAPRLGLAAYLTAAPAMFAREIAPGWAGLALLALLALAPLTAFARCAGARPAAALARAGVLATAATLVVHLAFAYRRHIESGWLGDLYPRYYFPLLGAYALGWVLAVRGAAGVLGMAGARFAKGPGAGEP